MCPDVSFIAHERKNQHLKVEGGQVEVNCDERRMIGEGDDEGCMQARVGGTIGPEATTAATRLYQRQSTLAVTRGVIMVDKRWQDHRKKIVAAVATADKNLQG
jgi:hypothetical protein